MSSPKERFLITGAGGCIGAWVSTLLAQEDCYVVGLDLDTTARRLHAIAGENLSKKIIIEQGDITNKDDIARTVNEHKITNVIHLAALQVPFCKADPILGAKVNVTGTVNLFEVVRDNADQIRGVTYASSVALFGPNDSKIASTDEHGVGAQPETLYGVYKQSNEGTARIYWLEHNVPSIGLRPYTVYGPGRDQGLTSAPTMAIEAAIRGEPYTIPFGGISIYNYAPDVATFFIQASRTAAQSTSREAQVFNIPGSRVDMEEVIATIEIAIPEAQGLINYDKSVHLPFPTSLATNGLKHAIGEVKVSAFSEAIQETATHLAKT